MTRTTWSSAGSVAGVIAGIALAQIVASMELAVKCPSSCKQLFGRLGDGVQAVQVQLRGGADRMATNKVHDNERQSGAVATFFSFLTPGEKKQALSDGQMFLQPRVVGLL